MNTCVHGCVRDACACGSSPGGCCLFFFERPPATNLRITPSNSLPFCISCLLKHPAQLFRHLFHSDSNALKSTLQICKGAAPTPECLGGVGRGSEGERGRCGCVCMCVCVCGGGVHNSLKTIQIRQMKYTPQSVALQSSWIAFRAGADLSSTIAVTL